jgi:hypothetical protein
MSCHPLLGWKEMLKFLIFRCGRRNLSVTFVADCGGKWHFRPLCVRPGEVAWNIFRNCAILLKTAETWWDNFLVNNNNMNKNKNIWNGIRRRKNKTKKNHHTWNQQAKAVWQMKSIKIYVCILNFFFDWETNRSTLYSERIIAHLILQISSYVPKQYKGKKLDFEKWAKNCRYI